MPSRPSSASRTVFWTVAAAALLLGAVTAWHYAALDLTLSHYDAKGHLVVARRIIDSLRPGWWQIGAVWLPLPHVLNMVPVQVDAWYRTGASGVAISIGCFAGAVGAVAWLVHRATGSLLGAAAGAVVLASQPDVLYLQATPMTEPLLMALTLGGVALTWRWTAEGGDGPTAAPGTMLALACLTRYEAWPITAAALGFAGLALLTSGRTPVDAARRVGGLAVYPIAAILGFLVLSRATVGSWLITGGFYVPDNPDYHRPFKSMGSVWWGLRQVNGNATVAIGVAGLALVAWAIARDRAHRALLVTLALAGCAALPVYAFYNGHPFRVRYMVVLTMMVAAATGLGIGLLPRGRALAAAVAIVAALAQTPPWSATAPMVLEAQWDRPHSRGRAAVRACLARDRRGEPILASMGSLAHLMQETAAEGIAIRDYIHEGIGQIWADSLEHPSRHAGWILVEERAEGGDVLYRRSRDRADFLRGFDRVCEGGGVALYRRR